MGLHVSAIYEVDRIRTEHPDWGFKQAMTAILNDTDPNMKLEYFREFFLHVFDTWEKASLREAKETQGISNGNVAKQARQYEEMLAC